MCREEVTKLAVGRELESDMGGGTRMVELRFAVFWVLRYTHPSPLHVLQNLFEEH